MALTQAESDALLQMPKEFVDPDPIISVRLSR